jgi:L-methionine (R)-S-oxide reductase
MISISKANDLLGRIALSDFEGEELRRFAMTQLAELPNYNWCGIYRLEGDSLVLDQYVGAETDHTHIPVGRGVCGTAVAENANQVIGDVRELENYLSCSLETRSEIVVLIRDSEDDRILGQIDIDGHVVDAFDSSDEEMLTNMARMLAGRW